MRKIFALGALLFLIVACGGFDTEAKKNEVLDIHDEVMPKIGQVMNLKRKLLEKAQTEQDSTKANELRDLAQELDQANEGMMVWMREWAKTSPAYLNGETSVEERKVYFEEEIDKVTKVKDDINNSIAAAKKELQ